MQTIDLDICRYQVSKAIYVKQGDVGRKFQAKITDCGESFPIPEGALLSVWYSGTSGEGNYSVIGENSAFEVEGNTVTVELITQMLSNKGGGTLCLILHELDGAQLGMWNIPYIVEPVPGMDSAAAQQYYTALSEAIVRAEAAAASFKTDKTLSVAEKAADASAVGAALKEKMPDSLVNACYAGVGYNGVATLSTMMYKHLKEMKDNSNEIVVWSRAEGATENHFDLGGDSVWMTLITRIDADNASVIAWQPGDDGCMRIKTRSRRDGVWGEWVDDNGLGALPDGLVMQDNYLSNNDEIVVNAQTGTDDFMTQLQSLYAAMENNTMKIISVNIIYPVVAQDPPGGIWTAFVHRCTGAWGHVVMHKYNAATGIPVAGQVISRCDGAWSEWGYPVMNGAWKCLWTNESPGSAFSAQKVIVSAGNRYKNLVVRFKYATNKGFDMLVPLTAFGEREVSLAGSMGRCHYPASQIGGTEYAEVCRYINRTDLYTLSFQDATKAGVVNNEVAIPVAVYGRAY